MSDLTPGLEPLFPVYSPGCNFVKGYIYETEAKGYKLQGLYGMNGNLVGFVTNSFSEQAWPSPPVDAKSKAKKKKKQDTTKEQEIAKIIETMDKYWTDSNKDKCGKNYEAIVDSHQKSHSQRRQEAVTGIDYASSPEYVPKQERTVTARELAEHLRKFATRCGDVEDTVAEMLKHWRSVYDDKIHGLSRRLVALEQEIGDHKEAIKKLQIKLRNYAAQPVAVGRLIPLVKRRKIKANGYRQEDNG